MHNPDNISLIALIVIFTIVGWRIIRKLRDGLLEAKMAIGEPKRTCATEIFAAINNYLDDFDPAIIPESHRKIKSVRSYRSGEFQCEFYGEFMRLYRVGDDKKIIADKVVFFHWLPTWVLQTWSKAEIFEYAITGWISDCVQKDILKGGV